MAGELLELVLNGDPAEIRRVTTRLNDVIYKSFLDDKSRPTQDEVKRRFKLCETLIRDLRSGHGWAFVRILDVLPTALRAKLDGLPWDPASHRAIWTP